MMIDLLTFDVGSSGQMIVFTLCIIAIIFVVNTTIVDTIIKLRRQNTSSGDNNNNTNNQDDSTALEIERERQTSVLLQLRLEETQRRRTLLEAQIHGFGRDSNSNIDASLSSRTNGGVLDSLNIPAFSSSVAAAAAAAAAALGSGAPAVALQQQDITSPVGISSTSRSRIAAAATTNEVEELKRTIEEQKRAYEKLQQKQQDPDRDRDRDDDDDDSAVLNSGVGKGSAALVSPSTGVTTRKSAKATAKRSLSDVNSEACQGNDDDDESEDDKNGSGNNKKRRLLRSDDPCPPYKPTHGDRILETECQHCGKWYKAGVGITTHQRSCKLNSKNKEDKEEDEGKSNNRTQKCIYCGKAFHYMGITMHQKYCSTKQITVDAEEKNMDEDDSKTTGHHMDEEEESKNDDKEFLECIFCNDSYHYRDIVNHQRSCKSISISSTSTTERTATTASEEEESKTDSSDDEDEKYTECEYCGFKSSGGMRGVKIHWAKGGCPNLPSIENDDDSSTSTSTSGTSGSGSGSEEDEDGNTNGPSTENENDDSSDSDSDSDSGNSSSRGSEDDEDGGGGGGGVEIHKCEYCDFQTKTARGVQSHQKHGHCKKNPNDDYDNDVLTPRGCIFCINCKQPHKKGQLYCEVKDDDDEVKDNDEGIFKCGSCGFESTSFRGIRIHQSKGGCTKKLNSIKKSSDAIDDAINDVNEKNAMCDMASEDEMNIQKADAIMGCASCGKDDDYKNVLLCEACDAEYHTYCLKPPLMAVPTDGWFCPDCTATKNNQDESVDSNEIPPASLKSNENGGNSSCTAPKHTENDLDSVSDVSMITCEYCEDHYRPHGRDVHLQWCLHSPVTPRRKPNRESKGDDSPIPTSINTPPAAGCEECIYCVEYFSPKRLAPHQETCKSRTKKKNINNRDDTCSIFIDNGKKGVTKRHPVENNDKSEASNMGDNDSVPMQKATKNSVATPGFNEGTYECSSCKKSFHPKEIARHRQSCYVKHQQVDQPSVTRTNISGNILQVAFRTQRLGLYLKKSDDERKVVVTKVTNEELKDIVHVGDTVLSVGSNNVEKMSFDEVKKIIASPEQPRPLKIQFDVSHRSSSDNNRKRKPASSLVAATITPTATIARKKAKRNDPRSTFVAPIADNNIDSNKGSGGDTIS